MAVGKEGVMGGSGPGMRKKAGREGRSPCQGGEMEEREETEPSGGTPGRHTAPFAQHRREWRSVNTQNTEFCGTGTSGPMDRVGQAAGFHCNGWCGRTHTEL